MKQLTNKKGFTLIELVIVLAIAALILVAIFIAVRGAQQSRQDGQRRDSASAIGALVEESAGNRKGCYPAVPTAVCAGGGIASGAFLTAAQSRTQAPLGGEHTPIAVTYAAGALPACPAWVATDQVDIFTNNARQWRVAMHLASQDVFCTDNL